MEDFVLNHMVVYDCALYAIMTMYGILFVSWFFDTKIWDWFSEFIDELQFFVIIFGLIFGVWYIGCALFGWEYRIIPHIIGSFVFGTLFAFIFGIYGWGWISDLREEVVYRRRKNRH